MSYKCPFNVTKGQQKIIVIVGDCYSESRVIRGIVKSLSNTRNSVSSGYPNTEKRVENTTRSGVFLTKFEVFG